MKEQNNGIFKGKYSRLILERFNQKKKLDSKHDKKNVNLDLEKFLIGLTRHQHLHIKFKGQLLVLLSQ